MTTPKFNIPKHIRLFCEGELRNYGAMVAEMDDALQAWRSIPDEGGNLGKLNPVGRVDGGLPPISQTEKLSGRRDKTLFEGKFTARHVRKIEDALARLEPQEIDIVRLYYWHKLNPEEIEAAEGVTGDEIFETRQRITRFLAEAWGIM